MVAVRGPANLVISDFVRARVSRVLRWENWKKEGREGANERDRICEGFASCKDMSLLPSAFA